MGGRDVRFVRNDEGGQEGKGRRARLPGPGVRDQVENRDGRFEGKDFVILLEGWVHHLSAELLPGVLSEADADRVFRTFRPK